MGRKAKKNAGVQKKTSKQLKVAKKPLKLKPPTSSVKPGTVTRKVQKLAESELTVVTMTAKYGKNGFELGLIPNEIVGATQVSGVTTFLMSWLGCDDTDLIPAPIANVNCPQMVIKFYEKRIKWQPLSSPENSDAD